MTFQLRLFRPGFVGCHPTLYHLLEHVLFNPYLPVEGCRLFELVARLGGEIGAFTQPDETWVCVTIGPQHATRVAEILSDSLAGVYVEERQFAVDRTMVLSEGSNQRQYALLGHLEKSFIHPAPWAELCDPGVIDSCPTADAFEAVRTRISVEAVPVVVCSDHASASLRDCLKSIYGRFPTRLGNRYQSLVEPEAVFTKLGSNTCFCMRLPGNPYYSPLENLFLIDCLFEPSHSTVRRFIRAAGVYSRNIGVTTNNANRLSMLACLFPAEVTTVVDTNQDSLLEELLSDLNDLRDFGFFSSRFAAFTDRYPIRNSGPDVASSLCARTQFYEENCRRESVEPVLSDSSTPPTRRQHQNFCDSMERWYINALEALSQKLNGQSSRA